MAACKATNHTGTLRNLLNPAGTYTNTRWNSSEPSGTVRTLPLEPTPPWASIIDPDQYGFEFDSQENSTENIDFTEK